jgi:G:T-mismatch repair DNA endonuclease (very short patch repair protein)
LDFTTSLDNYIKRYGKEIGVKKYKERNAKISKANTFSWYIEKYGENEGKARYDEFRNKKHNGLGPSKSKISQKFNNLFNKYGIKYHSEYTYTNERGKKGYIDFYLPDYNIAVEFYGDYWHCNPNIYNKDYYHKILKKFSYETWEKDRNRIHYIFEKEFNKNATILIIWESTKFTEEYLLELLNNIKGKKTLIEI